MERTDTHRPCLSLLYVCDGDVHLHRHAQVRLCLQPRHRVQDSQAYGANLPRRLGHWLVCQVLLPLEQSTRRGRFLLPIVVHGMVVRQNSLNGRACTTGHLLRHNGVVGHHRAAQALALHHYRSAVNLFCDTDGRQRVRLRRDKHPLDCRPCRAYRCPHVSRQRHRPRRFAKHTALDSAHAVGLYHWQLAFPQGRCRRTTA